MTQCQKYCTTKVYRKLRKYKRFSILGHNKISEEVVKVAIKDKEQEVKCNN